MAKSKNRITYLIIIIIVILTGLISRWLPLSHNKLFAKYPGDILWALMVFFIICFIFNRFSTKRTAVTAMIFSVLIEASQLYHANWIDSIRNTWLGGIILGFSFSWYDIICYAIGITIGILLEEFILFKYSFNKKINQ